MSKAYWAATVCVFLLLLLTWYASRVGWGLPTTAHTETWSVRNDSIGTRSYSHTYSGGYSGGGSHGGK